MSEDALPVTPKTSLKIDAAGTREKETDGPNEPCTAANLFFLAQQFMSVKVSVNPPRESPTVIQDTYIDTGTLNLLYDPPIQRDNRSIILTLHPGELSDIYTVGSYVISSIRLVIAPRPNGDFYDVTFRETDTPTQFYFMYNSAERRCAVFERRRGGRGNNIDIFLIPRLVDNVPPPQNRIISAVRVDSPRDIPFSFQIKRLDPSRCLIPSNL